jgi:hypothetical protein
VLPSKILLELEPGEFALNLMVMKEGLRQEKGGKAIRHYDKPEEYQTAIESLFANIGRRVKT